MDNHWENKMSDNNRSAHSSMSSNPALQNFMMSSHPSTDGDHQFKDIENPCLMNHSNQGLENLRKQQYLDTDAPKGAQGPYLLPLARIKKVMKSNEKVKMVSAETPMVFSKACEMLIMELSLRAWDHTTQNKRKTLQRCDVAKAIQDDKTWKFLEDVAPVEFDQAVFNQDQERVDSSAPPPGVGDF